jgi:hypothetical protein
MATKIAMAAKAKYLLASRITSTQGALRAHRVDDGIKPGKQVGSGEQVRQQIDATMPDLAAFGVMPFFDMLIDR